MPTFTKRLKNLIIGEGKSVHDTSVFHKLTLVAFFAWVGLGADGLSSSCYGPEEAFRAMTGRGFDGLWRAPGGRTTPNALAHAAACGFTHAGWSEAGFSGDELPSERWPGDKLIARQARDIRDGDVLLWHLGIWSRAEPLWPRLDELIVKLKARGLCFARLPDDRRWIRWKIS